MSLAEFSYVCSRFVTPTPLRGASLVVARDSKKLSGCHFLSRTHQHICVIIWFMGRREVLVQLDDDLVARLDRLAKERGTNRSELLRRGAVAVLDAEELRQADAELQASYRFTPQDPIIVEAAARLASETIPNW
jgi:ribbon-helix-helix CopG family protein